MFVPTSSPAQLLSLCKYQFWSLLRYPFWYFWVCLMDFSTQMPCQNFYLIRSKTNLLTLQINKFSFFTLLFEHPLLRNSKLCLSPLSFLLLHIEWVVESCGFYSLISLSVISLLSTSTELLCLLSLILLQ